MRHEVREVVRAAVSPLYEQVHQLEKSIIDLQATVRTLEQQVAATRNGGFERSAPAVTAIPATKHVGPEQSTPAVAAIPPTSYSSTYPARNVDLPSPTGTTVPRAGAAAVAVPVAVAISKPVAAVAVPVAVAISKPVAAAVPDDGEIPWELSGSRRRTAVAWIVGTLVVLVLGVTCGAAILSQLGYKGMF